MKSFQPEAEWCLKMHGQGYSKQNCKRTNIHMLINLITEDNYVFLIIKTPHIYKIITDV